MTNGADDASATQRTSNRKVIHATCALHRGPAGFANLVISQRGGVIEFDPHVTGSCVLTLAADEAAALAEAIQGWLG